MPAVFRQIDECLADDSVWKRDDELMPNEFPKSEEKTPHPQFFRQLRAFEHIVHPISFYEGDLQAECRQPDDDEERISQKAREDVSFSVDFPSVDLVEQRHLTGGERVTDIVKISH